MSYSNFDEASGNMTWFDENDQMHREDGPAVIYDGGERWYQHGRAHRIGGPAITYANGRRQYWYIDNNLHREDGPAVTDKIKGEAYWLYNINITEWIKENNYTMPLTEDQMIEFKMIFM